MLKFASRNPLWEVIMLGYHMMHQVALRNDSPETTENDISTGLMFVVRTIFSVLERSKETIAVQAADVKVTNCLKREAPLDLLIYE